MHKIKKKQLYPYYLLFLILLFSIFSMPVKSLTNQFIGGIIPSLLCTLLLIYLLTYWSKYSDNFKLNKLDLPILLLLFYDSFHVYYSHIYQNTFFHALQYYRVQILSMSMYFFIRKELSLNEDNRKYIINIISIIFLIILIDITVESVLRNIYGIDLSTLPWVENMPLVEVTIFTQTGIRIPTILGMPHKAGLIAVSSVVFYYFLFKTRKRRIYLFATFFAIMNVILSNSHSVLLILALILFLLRREKTFLKTALLPSFFSIIIFSYIFSKYSQYSISILQIIYNGVLSYIGTFELENLKLIPFADEPLWSINNISTYLFGIGIYKAWPYHNDIYAFFRIEAGLLDVLIKQGIVFFLLFLFLFLRPLKIKINNSSIRYLKIMISPFLLIMFHYWITFHMGIFEIFITLYGLLIAEIINYREKYKIASTTELTFNRQLQGKVNYQPL